jgi:hypothetical protein
MGTGRTVFQENLQGIKGIPATFSPNLNATVGEVPNPAG